MELNAAEEIKRVKVELGEEKSVLLYDSARRVDMDEVREHCEANGMEVPGENSMAYWDIVGNILDFDRECFELNLESSRVLPGKVVVTGSVGAWNGVYTLKPSVVSMEDPVAFIRNCTQGCGQYELSVGYDANGLFVQVRHHDGTNTFRVRELTAAGQRHLDRCERHGVEPDILGEEKFTGKIDYYIY